MENINFNEILDRNTISNQIKTILNDFENNKNNLLFKRGIYIYGAPGCGKTKFTEDLLKELDYDIIKFDAGDIRNKSVIENITKHNMADKNVISMFSKKSKNIAIIMDEIDGMNNGDKGGINSLIKLIRPKKTKKQKLEEISCNPIICISNYHIDKKITELMNVCNTFEIKTPTNNQINNMICLSLPEISCNNVIDNIVSYIDGDLRKFVSICSIYKNNNKIFETDIIKSILKSKTYNEDTKNITKNLILNKYNLDDHLNIMNETDRTIIGLLWHENIIDVLAKKNSKTMIPLYLKLLDNICFSDYIDRITFQKQIWQFNEMSSLIKILYNNKILHDSIDNMPKFNNDVRFTKVLTKYSTEYNNSLFIQNLCQELGLDKKDLFAFFLDIRDKYNEEEIMKPFESYDITILDVNRIYRYLDKYITPFSSNI